MKTFNFKGEFITSSDVDIYCSEISISTDNEDYIDFFNNMDKNSETDVERFEEITGILMWI